MGIPIFNILQLAMLRWMNYQNISIIETDLNQSENRRDRYIKIRSECYINDEYSAFGNTVLDAELKHSIQSSDSDRRTIRNVIWWRSNPIRDSVPNY